MAQAISPKENLNNQDAVAKLKELAEKARTCMFTTSISSDTPTTRPMTVQEVDENGTLWFIGSSDTETAKEIGENNRVQLYFMNSGSYEFVYVLGDATLSTDKSLIEKYWTEIANAWFDGKEDPRVRVISVKPSDSYYWDTKDGKIVSLFKIGVSALTGKKMEDGGVEGTLNIDM